MFTRREDLMTMLAEVCATIEDAFVGFSPVPNSNAHESFFMITDCLNMKRRISFPVVPSYELVESLYRE